MNTQDAIRIAELETAEARNRRGWTPEEIRNLQAPVGTTDQFHQTWQALMQQLERVLSLAHQHRPNRTETREAISIAKHLLGKVGDQIDAAQHE
ncbi:MAG: hypothetical protein PHX41_00525 [Kiritimatiellae bacterium]|nr:hypothetical protein [Kiritimatiellia bacterium]